MTNTDLAKDIAALAVVGVAYAVNPTAITALGATPSLLGLGSRILSRFSDDPQHITTRAVHAVLAGMQQSSEISDTLLDDARAALRDMPDTTRLTPRQLVAATKNGNVLVVDLVKLLMSQIPQRTNKNARGLIETALSAGVRACTETEDFRTALSFDLLQDLCRDMTQVKDNTTVTREMTALLLAGLDGMHRPEMNTLAHRFGHPDPMSAELTNLKSFLLQRAEDLRRYQAQIGAIDDRVAGLGNLKAAAKDAAQRLDFAEVDMLLGRVDEVETNIAAQTKELRADNALLQGKVDAAYAHLSAAADSFQGLDPLEPARRRLRYAAMLHQHGERYGSRGLELAARTLQTAIANVDSKADPELWFWLNNDLAAVYQVQGARSDGVHGKELLSKTAEAYREARKGLSEKLDHGKWATLHHNLALVLKNQSHRCDDIEEKRTLLLEARAVIGVAVEIIEQTASDQHRAEAKASRSMVLQSLSTITPGETGDQMLRDAVGDARSAAGALSEIKGGSEEWASAQITLGGALLQLANRIDDDCSLLLLDKALQAYGGALTIFGESSYPQPWARVQAMLAHIHFALARRNEGSAPVPHLRAALVAVDNALRVFDPVHSSYHLATTTKLHESISAKLRDMSNDL